MNANWITLDMSVGYMMVTSDNNILFLVYDIYGKEYTIQFAPGPWNFLNVEDELPDPPRRLEKIND